MNSTTTRRRAVPNIADDIALRERTHPAGFEGTDDARRYGAELLGRALGHEGATLHNLSWYELYAAAAYDGLNLCPSLHIMAAQAMDATRDDGQSQDTGYTYGCCEHCEHIGTGDVSHPEPCPHGCGYPGPQHRQARP